MDSDLDHLLEMYRLKTTTRTGWARRGVGDPESVADHSWGTALLCLLLADEAGVDRARAVQMALSHDLAEALTGDIVVNAADPEMDPAEKARLEREAMERLAPAPDHRLRRLWEAYEAHADAEARFVRDMDLLDMCIQALIYRREGAAPPDRLEEFFASADERIETATGRRLFEAVRGAFSRGEC
jgi:putative hydrolase of HD superfamily